MNAPHTAPVGRTRRAARLSALTLALLAGTSSAQTTISWNTGTGLWSNAANWLPQQVPSNSTHAALISIPGIYTVTYDINANLGGLSITNPSADLDILANHSLFIATSDMTNEGLITINPLAAASNTCLQFSQTTKLSGAGSIILNAAPGNLITAYIQTSAGATLTQGPDHTIAGLGRIYALMVNNGTISADVTNQTLELLSSDKTNNGLMSAVNGGTLLFNGIAITQDPAGVIRADGGTALLHSSSVTGGTLEGLSGGQVSTNPGTNSALVGGTVDGVFNIAANSSLSIYAPGIEQNGLFTINPTAADATTYMQYHQTGVLGGTGELVLNAGPNLIDAYLETTPTDTILTHTLGHTISGTGRIYGNILNQGVIRANQSGKVLELLSRPKTNSNVMLATAGGTLYLNGFLLTQTSTGILRADGGNIRLHSATVSGGSIQSVNSGLVTTIAGTGAALDGVAVSGPFDIVANSSLSITNSLFHSGTLTINPAAVSSTTYLQFDQNGGALGGTGEVVLNAAATLSTAYIETYPGAVPTTHAAGHTISGTGRIHAYLANDGLIRANRTDKTLELLTRTKTNSNLMLATNGGTLYINGITIGQTPTGILRADGGFVRLRSATIVGGLIDSVGTGLATTIEGTGSALDGAAIAGPFHIVANSNLAVTNNLSHSGVITINPAAADATTFLQFNQNGGSLGGTGEIILNAHPANRSTAYIETYPGSNPTTHAATHTISGSGRIHGNFLNEGLIRANQTGKTLELLTRPKTNNATFSATNTGTLLVNGITITQSAAGRFLADNGTVQLQSASIAGGSFESANSGRFTTTAGTGNGLNGVTINAPLDLVANSTIDIAAPTLLNNNLITINTTAAQATTQLNFPAPTLINGSGAILLNSGPTPTDAARLVVSGGALTLGPAQTLSGIGRIFGAFINEGRLDPGAPLGSFLFVNTLTLQPTSTLISQLGGTNPGTTYDQVVVNQPAAIAGRLRVLLQPGFTPGPFDSFTILTSSALTGRFDQLELPPFPTAAAVVYTPTSVIVTMCYANCDNSTIAPHLNVNDFVCFNNRFSAGDPYANCDGSTTAPTLNVNDFICYMNRFAAGCS